MYFNRMVGYYGIQTSLPSSPSNEIASHLPSQPFLEFQGARHGLYYYLQLLKRHTNARHIICPGWSCSILPITIAAAGFKPIFLDVKPETLQLNFDDIKQCVDQNDVAAIVLVAENGIPYTTESIEEIKSLKIRVILDYALAWQCGIARLPHNGDVELYSAGFSKPVSSFDYGIASADELSSTKQFDCTLFCSLNYFLSEIYIFIHKILQKPEVGKFSSIFLPKDKQHKYNFNNTIPHHRARDRAISSLIFWSENLEEYIMFIQKIYHLLSENGIKTLHPNVFENPLSKILVFPVREPKNTNIEFHKQYSECRTNIELGCKFGSHNGINYILNSGYSFSIGLKAFLNKERFLTGLQKDCVKMI